MWILNCLCAAIPARERVITAKDVFELRVPFPGVVSMQTRQPNLEGAGEIPLRRLVKEALPMRPSRLMVGEVRQAECLDLHDPTGSSTTYTRSCPRMSGENRPTEVLVSRRRPARVHRTRRR